MLTLDTSGILAAANGRDPHHSEATSALRSDGGPYLVPAGIMAEVTYMIDARLGDRVLDAFLGDLEEGAFILDCGENDLPRVRELIIRYRDLPLGYADASVVACAERHGGLVLTFDLRHFAPLALEGFMRMAQLEDS